MSSNVSQSYPYSSESDEERAAAVAAAFRANEGLEERVGGESRPLGASEPGENRKLTAIAEPDDAVVFGIDEWRM